MRMKGFRRTAGRGMPGRYESVREAAKNGFSASGRKALKVDVLEPVGTNSKRASCFGISGRARRQRSSNSPRTRVTIKCEIKKNKYDDTYSSYGDRSRCSGECSRRCS